MTKIAVFVGSLRDASVNKKLAQTLETMLPEGVTFEYADIRVPLYDQDAEAEFPAEAQALKTLVESADGVLFVTPEYNRSFPGALKNATDWASRPWGQNSFDGKPTGITGMSVGPTGASQAQQQLRNVMIYLNTKLMGQPEVYGWANSIFDEQGNLTEAARPSLQQYVDAFVFHVQAAK